MTEEKTVPICPKCKSVDVSIDFSNPGLISAGYINVLKVCNNCGYKSNLFPEIKISEIKKFKQNSQK